MKSSGKSSSERIGSVLDNKYEILSEIGRGGMSVVYLAHDRRLNKQWAIKEFRQTGDGFTDKVFRQSLLDETTLMKGLDHPGLPRIVDIIETKDALFMVMDFVEGEDLLKAMKKQGHPFSEEQVVDLGIQLCDVLNYLHTPVDSQDPSRAKPSIVYRDMKPSNVMLNDKGVARLVDFGIARKFDGGKSGDTVVGGTNGYAAPEQLDESVETDPRADIYSLGITLHQLVTGANPIKNVHNPRPIREYNPQLSEGLEAIIAKCTMYNRDARYQSCREVAYDLEHYKELTPEFRAHKQRKLNIFLGLSIASLVFLVVGICLVFASNQVKHSTYESYYAEGKDIAISSGASAGDPSFDSKIEALQHAVETDPSQAAPYEEILIAFYSDDEFSSDEAEKYYDLLTNYAKGNCPSYGELCYDFGNVYFSYASNYAQAYTWFSNALEAGSLSPELQANAETYCAICDFRKNLDSHDKLGNTGESAAFVEYWNELQQAFDSLTDGVGVTLRSKLTLCELIVDACSSEAYTVPFLVGGITKDELTSCLDDMREKLSALESQIAGKTDRELYQYIMLKLNGGVDGSGTDVESAYDVIDRTYASEKSGAASSDSSDKAGA